MKFQEFLEFFDQGGKISFTYQGKDYEFMRVSHGGNEEDVNGERSDIYIAVYRNGVEIYERQAKKYNDYSEYLEYLKNLNIGRSLEDIINNSLYKEGSLSMSHDMDITSLGDIMNRINVGYDFEVYYKKNLFYMSKCHGPEKPKDQDNLTFIYVLYEHVYGNTKLKEIKITIERKEIDSDHYYLMECNDFEQYYFFLKNLKVDGVKFTDIIANKLYTGVFC